MKILGLGGSDHSFSACILTDDGIQCAIEEERITREKHSLGPNSLYGKSRKYCLQELGVAIEDIDLIVGNDLLHPMFYFPVRKQIELMNHHLAHAYSAYYPIPHQEAAILVTDGTGSKVREDGNLVETVTYAVGRGNDVEVIDRVVGKKWSKCGGKETLTENSLGDFYREITEKIGFGYLQDGKTMGLAPYGTDRYYYEMRSFVTCLDDGQFEILINREEVAEYIQSILRKQTSKQNLFQAKADLAWAAQTVLEESMIYCLDYLYHKTKLTTLCIAGGVGLNSVINGKVRANTPFRHIYVPPYTSDSGTSIGAAYYGYKKLGGCRQFKFKSPSIYNPFLGHDYSDDEQLTALCSFKELQYTKTEDIYAFTARQLSRGKIICWFQGKSEMGPRALGHRSILADPRDANMKDTLNERVKHRESFRPFAPAVMEEYAGEYFDIDFHSPYMLFVVDVKKEKRDLLPAITHVDGSARVQTVSRIENPEFYNLLLAFYTLTGIPVLLNTSFNINSEPIVETPRDALNSFSQSNADILILGNWIVTKTVNQD